MAQVNAGEPLSPVETDAVERALADAQRNSGLQFNAYVGSLGDNPRAVATNLHSATADPARTVLVACDPKQRALEIVTGDIAGHGLTDGDCRLAAASMASSFQMGDFSGGLAGGIRQLAEMARSLPILHQRDAREINS